MLRRLKVLAIGAAISGAASAASAATQIQIQPVRLEFPAGRAGAFMLVNHGERDAVIEARAFKWRQQSDGTDILEPTTKVVLTPPIMRIKPGATQTIRLALLPGEEPPEGREGAYRLVLEELPSTDETTGINLRMRYVLPVFISRNAGAAGPVTLSMVGEGVECRIEAVNLGAKHVRIERMKIKAENQMIDMEAPLYLLAGAHLELACPEAVTGRQHVEGIRLESNAGVFTDAGGADGAPHP